MFVQHNRSWPGAPGILKQLCCLLLFCSITAVTKSQAVPVKTAHPKNQPKLPSWITMMDDPNVNYYDAIKTFNDYWKKKIKPVEEDELDESAASANEMLSKRKAREKAREREREERRRGRLTGDDPTIKYAFEYKRFLHWQLEMEPFVQPDGHIKNMDQRIKDWETQKQDQKNRKKQTDSSHQKNKPQANQ